MSWWNATPKMGASAPENCFAGARSSKSVIGFKLSSVLSAFIHICHNVVFYSGCHKAVFYWNGSGDIEVSHQQAEKHIVVPWDGSEV